jgi:putative membrane protein
MANERTFLAWIRTSIGIMAFGFVVEKFALFLRQLYFILGKQPAASSPGYSSIFGATLVGFGALMGVLSFVRYKKVEKQIDSDSYQPSSLLDIMVTLTLLAIAVFLIIYLLHSA